MVIESREAFDLGAPRPFIGRVIDDPGIALEARKREKHLVYHFGTEEQEQFSPVATSLVKETVDGVFLSLKNGIPGMEET
jgi:hypothetical protein